MISSALLGLSIAASTIGFSSPLPAAYRIEARLDTAGHVIYGAQEILFRNTMSKPLRQLCFHLYPNAFKDTSTVFCRESEEVRADVASGNISALKVSDLRLNGKDVDTGRIDVGGTLMYIDLLEDLPPGGEVEISMKFELLIPRIKVRFGYDSDGNYLLSHWYPILCGYQKERLIDREYHTNSEFFSNFASYSVVLELPPDFTAGSTGDLKLVDKNDEVAVWHAQGEPFIDFAFACGPGFEILESDTLGIKIHYLLKNKNMELCGGIDKITKYSLVFCSDKLFKYPYRNFTFVDFRPGAGGLELPGLISVAIRESRSVSAPTYLDNTIAHETAHQWFYATIATNEFEEPWLDEGLTTYFTSKIVRSFEDRKNSVEFWGYDIPLDELSRTFALLRKAPYPISLKSWEYPDLMDYSLAVYSRAQLVFQTLEGIIGDSVFAGALKDFAEKYRFGHPDGEDLLSSISSSTGLDLDDFFLQFINGTARVDYGITSLRYDEISGESESGNARYKIVVDLRRELDGIIPQKITVGLCDGAKIDTIWDGRSGVASFEFVANSESRYACINEDNVFPLDENRTNDIIYSESHSMRLVSFEWDAVFALEFILSLLL
jgi:hypothetical protein